MPLPIHRRHGSTPQLRSLSTSRNKHILFSDIPVSVPSPVEDKRFALASYTSRVDDDIPEHAPIFDRLPVELQVEIFSQCLPPFPRFNTNEAPLLVAQVCGAWRMLALSTPRLWSSFEIEVQGSGTSISDHDVHVMNTMKLWLKRSRNHALSFKITHVPIGHSSNTRSAQLLSVLIPHARRWRHVKFIIPSSSILSLQKALPDGFPVLQTVTLRMKGIWQSSTSLDIRSLQLPWHRLTTLDLQPEYNRLLALDDCLHILSQATNLIRCTMSSDCVFSGASTQLDPVMLPSLESLRIILQGGGQSGTENSPEAQMVSFLRMLSLPKLRNLRLEWLVQWRGGDRNWSSAHTNFVAFLQESARSLEGLTLSYLPLGDEEVIECLRQLPCLRDLDLRFSLADREHDPITDRLFGALTLPMEDEKETPSPELPMLTKMHLLCQGESYANSSLQKLIRSRWKPRSSEGLKAFHLLSMKHVSEDLSILLKEWNDEGLDITCDAVIVR